MSAVAIARIMHARYIARIRRHIYAVLGPEDEGEDVLQEVLMKVFYRHVARTGALRCLGRASHRERDREFPAPAALTPARLGDVAGTGRSDGSLRPRR